MKRFHRDVYFPSTSYDDLLLFCKRVNAKEITRSAHADDKISDYPFQLQVDVEFALSSWLDPEMVFEYYVTDDGNIEKACFRFELSVTHDLIAIITNDGMLVTCYVNSKRDFHATLSKNLYSTED